MRQNSFLYLSPTVGQQHWKGILYYSAVLIEVMEFPVD